MGGKVTLTRPTSALRPIQRQPVLEVDDGSPSPRTVALDGESFVIGRGPDADLRLDVDGVSRKHARITRVGQALSMVDLGSKNGTYVNGERVDVAALHHDDRIQLGPVVLRFVLLPQEQAAAPAQGGVLVGRLSPREREVAMQVARGLTNAEIAEVLGVTRRTVATHLERVYQRLGIHSRAALANLVARDPNAG